MALKQIALLALVLLALTGCKAKLIEVEIDQSNLIAVIEAGDPQSVEFSAVFSGLGELDDAARVQIDQISNVASSYFEGVEIEVDKDDFGYELEFEGEIPLVAAGDHENIKTPWFVIVEPATDFEGWYVVRMSASDTFSKFTDELQSINMMLSPDFANPTKFKLKLDGLMVMAPAVVLNGREELLFVGNLDGKNSLIFRDGVFDTIGAGFYFKN